MPSTNLPDIDRGQLARGLEPLFGDLPDEILTDVAEQLEPRGLTAGELLVAQGDPGDSIFIVLSGRLCATVTDDDGHEREVAEIAAGESVGETSLLTRRPHSVSYRAIRDSVLVRLSQASFVELSHTQPGLLWNVARLVTQRLDGAQGGATRTAKVRTVAVMFLDDAVDRRSFLDRLGLALGQHGNQVCVDSSTVAGSTVMGSDETWAAGWLDRLENAHRFVLMQLDDTASEWSRLCVRQADRVLLVASATGDPAVTALETELLGESVTRAARSLILLHDTGAERPTGTARWLKDRDLLRHHHVRLDHDRDFARVARFQAGEAVGLVLAGGGAKAFVHLGVIKALEEAGVTIDMVGGSSLGSILAAGVAWDWDPAELEAQARLAFTGRNPLTDYSFPPLVSMMKGKRIEKLLRRFLGEGDIEDLWLPYFCVSGNFSVGAMAVHRSGKLWRAIKASISLPGILPPTVIDGQLHVDGGTFDNFPVEPMRAAGAGRIIASDIWMPIRPNLGYDETPSGWRFFWEKYVMRRRKLKVPHVMTTLFRSSFLASSERRRAAKQGADLYFCSPPGRVGLTTWKGLDEAMASGYKHANKRLAEVGAEGLVGLTISSR